MNENTNAEFKRFLKTSCLVKFLITLIIAAILVIAALKSIAPLTRFNYIFENGQIVFHDLRSGIPMICATFLAGISVVWSVCAVVITIIKGITRKADIGVVPWTALLIFIDIIMAAGFLTGAYLHTTACNDSFFDNYCPEFYTFEHDDKRIVMAEGAYFFDGCTAVYQVFDDNTAWEIGSFHTDDGAVNGGKYDLEWSESGISITYDTGTSAHTANTVFMKWTDKERATQSISI